MGTTGLGSLNVQSSLMQATQDRLLQQVKSGRALDQDAKIDKGSKDFESMLLGTWLQQAEQSFATVPGAEDDDDAAGREQMMSLGVQSLSKGLVAAGGIGIAKMVANAMHAQANKAENHAVATAKIPDSKSVAEKD